MPPQAPISVGLNISAVATLAAGNAAGIAIVQGPIIIPRIYTGSFPNPVTPGNCLVVGITALNATSGHIPAVTGVTIGGAADNFVKAASAISGLSVNEYNLAAIWIDYNCAAGQVIAVNGSNFTSSGNAGIVLWEISGLPGTNPVDKTSTATATANANWSSGATANTSQPNEIWFGLAMTDTIPTVLPALPWVTAQWMSGGFGGTFGSQITSAEAAATFAGTQTSADGWAAVVVTLEGAFLGGAIAQAGPLNQRELWYPQVVSVSATSAILKATCKVYAGSDTTQPNFVWSTPDGSTGDSTANIAGPGLTAQNLPGRVIRCNEYIFAVWAGGDAGAQGRLNIQGTKLIGSGGPPGWVHARTRPP